ncbi:MAG: GNAT family N-acetyltransferase [Candidatus Cloacimonetes bacterium]|nr:GNAT family N-acetyltransferase [Candidatus Cloacimonadota bacterium]
MIRIEKITNKEDLNNSAGIENIIDFLYEHLGRYGDSRDAIAACLEYVFSEKQGMGGEIFLAVSENKIAAAAVIIKTGMRLYIPENFLVYIAVHKEMRNQGLGSRLLDLIKKQVSGDIALHVEFDNPAGNLYERAGFSKKYAEMRYHKEE